MQPLASGRFVRPEFTAAVATNSLGLRDDEIVREKPPNEIRILLLGDSVVAGFEVEREETLEAQLQTRLNRVQNGFSYQVINCGFRGYGTDQELLFLQTKGLALKPDMVILAFVPANDPENNVTIHTANRIFGKPYFTYAADSTLLLQGVPVPQYPVEQQIYSPIIRENANTGVKSYPTKPHFLKKFVSENLYLYGFVVRRLKSGSPALVSFLQRSGILKRTIPDAYVDFYRSAMPESWRKRWQLTQDLLLKINRLCVKENIPFVVWMFPLKEQVYERDRRIFLQGFGLDATQYDFDLPERILQEFCASNGIFFFSPLAQFRKMAFSGERFHYISDDHFNAAGHALMAEELFRFLSEKALLATQLFPSDQKIQSNRAKSEK
jgi:lysophospholipase L1-like esterase